MKNLFILVCASLMLLGGCVRSLQPVLTDDQVTLDPDLAGRWASDDGKASFTATPDNDAKRYDVVYTDEDGKTGDFVVRVGKVGALLLAEVSPKELPSATSDMYRMHFLPVYSFLLVEKTKAGITLSTMSAEWLAKYMGKASGELQVTGEKDHMVVTSSTAELQKFILKHYKDEDAMGKPTLFVRPGPATATTK